MEVFFKNTYIMLSPTESIITYELVEKLKNIFELHTFS